MGIEWKKGKEKDGEQIGDGEMGTESIKKSIK
jgi:hypothetical protein